MISNVQVLILRYFTRYIYFISQRIEVVGTT